MSPDDSSELSSVPSDNESDLQLTKTDGLLKFFSKNIPISKLQDEDFPTKPKRDPSPEHDYILADNPNIAFIVMFRSRFTEAFPKSLVNFGPQELEQDIVQTVPGEGVESFLCALLSLLLNRKQDVKSGHYNRALEEAIQSHKSQWAKDWQNKTPLSKGATFSSMTPEQRLTLLRTLILWALSSSDVIKGIIQSSYKQQRQEDDLNQPLSVQPWGSDSDRRRYYLIEGLYDTQFRVYRESNYNGLKCTWWSVASNIEELKSLAEKLRIKDGGQRARLLSSKILAAIPRFEAVEEKRKRKEYRATRKQIFKRVDPDYSIYEGRTRGKRIKYTFSDEEDILSDVYSSRRSMRSNESNSTVESNAPTITQSGRQVKSRQGGAYGESVLSKVSASTLISHQSGEEHTLKSYNIKSGEVTGARRNGYFTKSSELTHLRNGNYDDGKSSEEDDTNTQDYNVEEESSPESDFNAPEDFSDEYNDLDGDTKKLIVKKPVQTSTPEKRAITRLQLKPEKGATQDIASLVSKDDENEKGYEAHSTKYVGEKLNSTKMSSNFTNNTNTIPDSSTVKNLATSHSPLAC